MKETYVMNFANHKEFLLLKVSKYIWTANLSSKYVSMEKIVTNNGKERIFLPTKGEK